MDKAIIRRFLCMLLLAGLLANGTGALALTGQEALGLTSGTTDTAATDDNTGDDQYGAENTSGTAYLALQLGSRDGDDAGAYVVMLQNRLISLGYLSTTADGQFGQQTQTAVVAFQESNGLTSTGIADETTQSILYSDDAQRAPTEAIAETETLRVQQKLSTWGFLIGTPDGVLGDDTRTAVAAFKEYIYKDCAAVYAANVMTPEPTVDATLAPGEQPVAVDVPLVSDITSESGYNGDITADVVAYVDGDFSFQIFQKTLTSGETGAEVWRLQRRLHQLNYLYSPDGSYGQLTQYALASFQTKNGLQATGTADQATQERLYSDAALGSEEYVFPYKVYIDISDQRVYVLGWDGTGYTKELKKFKCSTGKSGYDTPLGTYQSGGKCTSGEWYYFKDYGVYAKYATRIVGGVLFHSVLYNGSKKGPTSSSVSALGRKASHGCVRLAVDDAKWIFENCPMGTTIVVQA